MTGSSDETADREKCLAAGSRRIPQQTRSIRNPLCDLNLLQRFRMDRPSGRNHVPPLHTTRLIGTDIAPPPPTIIDIDTPARFVGGCDESHARRLSPRPRTAKPLSDAMRSERALAQGKNARTPQPPHAQRRRRRLSNATEVVDLRPAKSNTTPAKTTRRA